MNIDLGLKETEQPKVVDEPVEEVYYAHAKFKIVLVNGKPKIVHLGGFCSPVKNPRKPKKEKRKVIVSQKPMEIETGEF